MCRLLEGMDSDTYITILQDELMKTMDHYYPDRTCCIFQQDKAPWHTSTRVSDWFKQKKIVLLPWPGNSPDLNPIEHLWADLKKRIVKNYPDIRSKEQLLEAIQLEYEATSVETCKKLVHSMPASSRN